MNLEESNEFLQAQKIKNRRKKLLLALIILCIVAVLALVALIILLKVKDANTKKIFLNNERKNYSETLFIEQNGKSYASVEELANFLGYKFHLGEYTKYNQDVDYCYFETGYEVVSIKADSYKVKKYMINGNSTEEDESKTQNNNSNNSKNLFIVKSKNNTMELFDLSYKTIKYQDKIYVPLDDVEKIYNIKFEVNGNVTYISNLNYLYQVALNKVNNNKSYTEISNYYENIVALVSDYLIVKDDYNKYGVVSLTNNNTKIIDFVYTDIQYIQNKEEFFVYTQNTVGLITKDKETIISPISYDELSVFDEINELYLVKSKKGYGILNRQGETIVPVSFENIGFSAFESYKEFEMPDSETPNLLQSKYIVVYENGSLGLYDIDGNIILKSVYDNLGYVRTEKDKKEGFDSVLLLPKECGINGIVIEQNGLYGIYNLDKNNLEIPCSLNKVYSITRNGNTDYYMVFEDEVFDISEYFSNYFEEDDEFNEEENQNPEDDVWDDDLREELDEDLVEEDENKTNRNSTDNNNRNDDDEYDNDYSYDEE